MIRVASPQSDTSEWLEIEVDSLDQVERLTILLADVDCVLEARRR